VIAQMTLLLTVEGGLDPDQAEELATMLVDNVRADGWDWGRAPSED
jgi:hypothetical protein